MISLWNGFGQVGNTWAQGGAFIEVIEEVYEQFKPFGYVHYFNTTGIMQHNDIVSDSSISGIGFRIQANAVSQGPLWRRFSGPSFSQKLSVANGSKIQPTWVTSS